MRLEIEGQQAVDGITEIELRSSLSKLRSYGPSSFALLADETGSYLQVAGGGSICMIERRDISSNTHYRGYQHKESPVFADGTTLVFGGGEIKLAANEWFDVREVQEVFSSFLNGADFPSYVMWRDVTAILK